MFYALIYDANGNILGVHTYVEQPDTYPAGEIACTPAQAAASPLWQVTNGVLVQNLAGLQAAQMASLKASCDASIVSGFTSSALGALYTYPSTPTDQINLMGSVTDSLYPGLPANWTTIFWCENSAGVWELAAAYRPSNPAGRERRQGLGDRSADQAGASDTQVAAATTPAAVQAITW